MHSLKVLFFPFIAFNILLPANGYSQNIDIDLLHTIHSGTSKSWDNTNLVITHSMTPISIGMPAAFLLHGLLKPDSATKRNSLVMGAGLLASGIVAVGMKYAINKPRPFVTYPLLITKKSEAGSPSFPSGHTSSAFATAASVSLFYPKWYVIAPSFLWASAVGYSRMELGVHYPSDVLVGAVIGVGSSWLCWKLNKQLAKKEKRIASE